MNRIICAILALVWSVSVAYAEGGICTQSTGTTIIAFGNGILTTLQDAKQGKRRLEDVLRAALSPDVFSHLEIVNAYNSTYNAPSDLYESALQWVPQNDVVESYFRWLSGDEAMPQQVRDTATQLEAAFDFSTRVGTHDLDAQLELYRTAILEGKPVVIVAHSQGNFFANAAYDTLYNGPNPIPLESLGIVSVANPASYVGGGGPYTTAVEDLVIQAISVVTPSGILPPLPPNITNIGSGAVISDPLGHSFEREYLADGSNTLPKIVGDVTGAVNGLVPPVPAAQSGVITVTLTWGAQPDVDLHVFEPDGTHVFYANKQGGSGYLDVDDTTSYGPEHYYVACSTLEAGTYRAGVNYFSGSAPETAVVQVSAGGSVRTFSIPLAAADGALGNNSPVPVADIVVTGDATAGYEFQIIGQ